MSLNSDNQPLSFDMQLISLEVWNIILIPRLILQSTIIQVQNR